MDTVATVRQHYPRQVRAPPLREMISGRKERPRSPAMSRERRPRYNHALRPPRSAASRSPSPASSAASTEASISSSERESDSSCTTDFDDLYDVSDDDSELVPIKCSNSIKALLSKNDVRRESLPSLVIPSPSAWPTIQKLNSAKDDIPPVPPMLPLSPQALQKLATQTLRVPGTNSTPSLDGGSSASDEPASISPSTPDLEARNREVEEWDPPIQLTDQALDTLHHLSPDFDMGGTIISAHDGDPGEMEERGLNISLMAQPSPPGQPKPPKLSINLPPSEPISAISVPSPGGFFNNLDNAARRTWSWAKAAEQVPSTTTAECFYDVPWDNHIAQVCERIVEIKDTDNGSEGPPTARQEQFTGRRSEDQPGPHEMVIRGSTSYDYDEDYQKKLHTTATSNANRTSMWLNAQDQYLSALKNFNPLNGPSEIPDPRAFSPSPIDPPDHVRKAVRFACPSPGKPKTPLTALRLPLTVPGASEPLFYHAFQHLLLHARAVDAHALRHLRADALHAQRLHLPDVHRAQLLGQYSIPVPARPDKEFFHLPNAPNDPAVQKHREEVARVDRERKAIQQVSLSVWHLEAVKFLSGGSLLPRPAMPAIDAARAEKRNPRVLDLGGLPTADWGWAVAVEHRDVRVYTAIVSPPPDQPSSSENDENEEGEQPPHSSSHRTPSNHRVLTVSKPYRLPFPSGSFDVISARTLSTLCKTVRPKSPTSLTDPNVGKSPLDDFEFPFSSDFGAKSENRGALPPRSSVERFSDEFAATLAEMKRVLAPGGVLCYEYLDAEVVSSTSAPILDPAPPGKNRKDSAISMASQVPAGRRERSKTTSLHARSVEFAVSLRQQDFDPNPSYRSISRLLEAGFKREAIQETTVELPCGGSDDGVGAISEIAGGVKWERWVLGTVGEGMLKNVGEGWETARRVGKDGERGGGLMAKERAGSTRSGVGGNEGGAWSWREKRGVVVNL